MSQLSYEIVAVGVDFFTTRMVETISLEDRFLYSEQCNSYIVSCGWTVYEFEEETLRRVDAAWDEDEQENSLWRIRQTPNS